MANVRIWAPKAQKVEVVLDNDERIELAPQGDGIFLLSNPLATGIRYRISLDGAAALPDPRSMRQPQGPHGPSEIVDPTRNFYPARHISRCNS